MIRDEDGLLRGLDDLRRIQRSRPVLDAEVVELLEAHLDHPCTPEEVSLMRTFLRRGPVLATLTAAGRVLTRLRELALDDEGTTTIPRWGGGREFSVIPEVVGDPPDRLTEVELSGGGHDLLAAVPAAARRHIDPTQEVEVWLHLGGPTDLADPDVLGVVMGDHLIGTVDVRDEPGLRQLAAEAVRDGRMLALEGRVLLAAPPRALIELIYR